MKLFEINFAQMMVRYYLMMLVIVIAGFTGQWWLAGLAFFIFLSAIMGANFTAPKSKAREDGKILQMGQPLEKRKAS
jgi:hypothetical protein